MSEQPEVTNLTTLMGISAGIFASGGYISSAFFMIGPALAGALAFLGPVGACALVGAALGAGAFLGSKVVGAITKGSIFKKIFKNSFNPVLAKEEKIKRNALNKLDKENYKAWKKEAKVEKNVAKREEKIQSKIAKREAKKTLSEAFNSKASVFRNLGNKIKNIFQPSLAPA